MATALGLLPACSGERLAPAQSVEVPAGSPIHIDGTWSEDEWQPAVSAGAGDLALRLNHAEGDLQVGVRAPSLGVASVCLLQDQRVYVFHASAALGRAVYRRGREEWELEEGFVWRVRTTEQSAEANAERNAHRNEHGWVASTARMGTAGESEFQIASEYLSPGGTRLAVGAFLLGDGAPTIAGWPFGPEQDGSTRQAVIAGPLPERTVFNVDEWITVTRVER